MAWFRPWLSLVQLGSAIPDVQQRLANGLVLALLQLGSVIRDVQQRSANGLVPALVKLVSSLILFVGAVGLSCQRLQRKGCSAKFVLTVPYKSQPELSPA